MQNRLPLTQTTSSSDRNQHQKIHSLQKTSIATVPIDNAGNTLALALDLGFLDTVPIDRTFSDFVGVSDRQDFYRFKLQANSRVNLNLNGLSANANLFLADAAGKLILSSTNAGNLAEAIATNLISGTYYVLVRPGAGANTDYDLTLSAQFIVDEEIVSAPSIPLPDPEFDPLGSRVTWQDKNNNLWVAPVNPETGEFMLSQAIALDSNLAPISSYRQRTGSGNGPEWVYSSQEGAEILYTKALGATQEDWFLYRARWTGTEWQVEPLPDADLLPQDENGLSPFGSLNPNDPNPRVFYVLPTPVGANSILAWRDLDEAVGGIVGETATFAGSWVNDESSSIVFTRQDSNRIAQIFQYNIDTQALEQLTFSATNKDEPYMWQAPEFNNQQVFFAVEKSAIEPDFIGVYLKQNGIWTQINTLKPPTLKQNIRSAEPFTYNGKSYISFLTEEAKGENSEVWIASIDPRFEFYRQVSDPNIEMVRNDPESFVSDTGAFIYYAERGSGIIYRADTGLGFPEQILATTTKNLTLKFNTETQTDNFDSNNTPTNEKDMNKVQSTQITTDSAANTLNRARDLEILDTNPFPQLFSDFVGIDDRKDFYRFELQNSSRVILNLDRLSADANLFLADVTGNPIASSTRLDNGVEAIDRELLAGSYYVFVRSSWQAQTNYDLTLEIHNDNVASNPNISLPDPEYDQAGFRIAWQDEDNSIWVAPVNSRTGEFILSQKVLIDTNAAPRSFTLQGPEWIYTATGSDILYTKFVNGDYYVTHATFNGTQWETGIIPETKGGVSAVGSRVPGDPNPIVRYFITSPENPQQSMAWLELNNPSNGGIVPGTSDAKSRSGRIVEGERAITYTSPVDGIRQVFKYDIDTDTLTQLTSSPVNKGISFMWKAPEFNNELVFFSLEENGVDPTQIGLYREINGTWTKFKTIVPPTGKNSIRSPEPFTYKGKSYISFSAVDVKNGPGSIWIVGIEPDVDFAREVNTLNVELVRNDPEYFITESGSYVYYTEKMGNREISHRADTGLGLDNNNALNQVANLTADILATNDRSILAAEFIPNDVVVSDPDVSLPDPEFDRVGDRITWQDFDNNLYVASIDPVTGDLLLTDGVGELLDTDLVPIFSLANGTGTGNGPEWVYTKDGAEIIYSKISAEDQWDLGRAQLTETGWQEGLLPGGGNGFSPLGSLDPNDETPRAFYLLRTPENPDGIDPKIGAWIDLKDSSQQGELDFEPGSGGRWVEGENSFILTAKDENDIDQIVKYDTDTETYEFLTTDPVKKDDPFMWKAPEFNDELVFFTIENSGSGPTQIGVYREIGGTWTKFKTIDPPSEKKFIDSPEFFVYNDKSYVFFLTQPRQNSKGLSELWLAGIDPDVDFYRELNDPDVDMVRSDPEFFVTESGAYIYYSEIVDDAEKTRIIHRTDTGLGEPVANKRFGSQNDDNLQLPSFFERYITFTGAGNDTLDAKEEQSPAIDRLYAGSDSDLLLAGTNDRLLGGEGNDTLDASTGGGGNRLYGGNGDDSLISGVGDRLFGGEGNDNLIVGLGESLLVGGAGVDRLIISQDSLSEDTDLETNLVADFAVGTDKIVISGLTIDDRPVNFEDLSFGEGIQGIRLEIAALSDRPLATFQEVTIDTLDNIDNFEFS